MRCYSTSCYLKNATGQERAGRDVGGFRVETTKVPAVEGGPEYDRERRPAGGPTRPGSVANARGKSVVCSRSGSLLWLSQEDCSVPLVGTT